MRLIGITGSIGAGKSVVSRILRLKGYEVYDCDQRARQLMENSADIKTAIWGRLGAEAILPDGTLNRKHMASRIFTSDSDREWLNKLVHEAVRRDILNWAAGGALRFVESAIMATSGLDRMCDEMWIVEAPEEVRLRRAIARGGDEADIMRRNALQENELSMIATPVKRQIDNSGATPLLPQIEMWLDAPKG